MPLDDLRNTIAKLSQFDWEKELETIIDNNADAIVRLQEDQLYEGVDSNNAIITLEGRGYSKKTFEIKTYKGQPTDRITWRDTGGLYAALEAKRENREVMVLAPAEQEKYDTMIERSGKEVLGLNEENRKQFGNNITLPAIKAIYKEKTSLEIS